MPDLKHALRSAGLLSERQFREAEATEQIFADVNAAKLRKSESEKEKRIEILRESNSPDQFRREARKLLLQQPTLVQQIINIAHERGMQKKKDKGGGRLIANLLQLREALSKSGLSDEDRTSIVDKTFTKR
jgi:hypothetical protein